MVMDFVTQSKSVCGNCLEGTTRKVKKKIARFFVFGFQFAAKNNEG